MMGHKSNSNRNIGAYNIPRKGPGRGGGGRGIRGSYAGRAGRNLHRPPGLESWDPTRPGAYYSRACYAALTPEQKQLNFETRDADPNVNGKSRRQGFQVQNAKRAATLAKVELAKSDLLEAKMDFLFQAVVGKGLVPHMATISSVETTPSTITAASDGASLKRKAQPKFFEWDGKDMIPTYDMK
jgi:hypothetical protein